MGSSPGAAVALTRMNAEIDIRDVLPSIRVPTLVLHRRGDRCLKVEEGRYLASQIPGADVRRAPGDDHLPFVGDQDEILVRDRALPVERPRADRTPSACWRRCLTVISDAGPADAEHLRRVFAREVAWYRGRSVAADAEPLVAMFDGPGRAVQCGCSVVAVAQRSRMRSAPGVHIGECDPAEPQGPMVEISRQIAADGRAGRSDRLAHGRRPGAGLGPAVRRSWSASAARLVARVARARRVAGVIGSWTMQGRFANRPRNLRQRRVAVHAAPPVPRIEVPFTRPVYFVVPTVNVISSPRSLPSVIGLPPSVPVNF